MIPLAEGIEFQNDIRHALATYEGMLSKVSSTFNGWRIMDTDDPCDLLLSWTEVTGSCQRVGGEAPLNKGLLGYLLNDEN